MACLVVGIADKPKHVDSFKVTWVPPQTSVGPPELQGDPEKSGPRQGMLVRSGRQGMLVRSGVLSLFGDSDLDQGRCWVDMVDSIYCECQLDGHCQNYMWED